MQKLQCALKPESGRPPGNSTIPTLLTVLDPCELGRSLYPVLSPHWGLLFDVEVKELKRHPGKRSTVEIAVQTTTGKHTLIGKFYSKDRSDVYRTMQQISESGFGPAEKFSIPQPLAFIPEQRLLLQQRVEGHLATEFFLSADENKQISAAESCGRWLARFHARGPVLGLRSTVGIDWVRRITKRLAPLPEALSYKARLLLQLLERVAAVNGKLCACHGSFSHPQIILSEGRTVVFDWDKYCISEPSSDVANFIIGLKQLALSSFGSLTALDGPIDAFLRSYAVAGGYDVNKRLRFYMAAQCLRRAKRHSKYGVEKTEALLDEGLRILTEEV